MIFSLAFRLDPFENRDQACGSQILDTSNTFEDLGHQSDALPMRLLRSLFPHHMPCAFLRSVIYKLLKEVYDNQKKGYVNEYQSMSSDPGAFRTWVYSPP